MSDDDWGNSDEDIPMAPKVADDWDDEPTNPLPQPGYDSDDSWDDEPKEKKEVKEEAKKEETKEEAKPAATSTKNKVNITNKKVQDKVEVYVPLADPAAEKLRLKKLQEEGEDDAIDDLFGGFTIKKDEPKKEAAAAGTPKAASSSSAGKSPEKKKKKEEEEDTYDTFFEEFHFQETKNVKDFCGQMVVKVEEIEKKAHMKGAVSNFLIKILQLCAEKCTRKELEELEKKLKEIQRARRVETTAKQAGKNKINDETNKHKQWNAADELDERFGDDDWEEGDWEEGDWQGGGEWAGGEWAEGGDWKE